MSIYDLHPIITFLITWGGGKQPYLFPCEIRSTAIQSYRCMLVGALILYNSNKSFEVTTRSERPHRGAKSRLMAAGWTEICIWDKPTSTNNQHVHAMPWLRDSSFILIQMDFYQSSVKSVYFSLWLFSIKNKPKQTLFSFLHSFKCIYTALNVYVFSSIYLNDDLVVMTSRTIYRYQLCTEKSAVLIRPECYLL